MESPTPKQKIEPPESPARRRRRRNRNIALALTAVLVVAGATYGIVSWINECAPGIARDGEECVGVTDGSFVFDDDLATVQNKIEAENDAIQDEPAVTVAVLMPMTGPPGANIAISEIRAYLEGAYIQQRNANQHPSNLKIRLVLANEGSREQASSLVAHQLRDMVDDSRPLVAVTGLGLSTRKTAESAKTLAQSDLPMVGYLNADALNTTARGLGGPIPGLVRVTTSLQDEVDAIAAHLEAQQKSPKALLVYDSNPNDLYTTALADDFRKRFRTYWEASGGLQEPYDGAPNTPGIQHQFNIIANRLCGEDSPSMVMYAGRTALLPVFIDQLQQRTCSTDRAITVVAGSDAAGLKVTLPAPEPTDAPVSVRYASVSEPAALSQPEHNPDWRRYTRFRNEFNEHFDTDHLRNGWAIMAHDALLTAVTAIRNVAGQEEILPNPQSVRGHITQLHGKNNDIAGVSGTFTIDPSTGDRISNQIPVVELTPNRAVDVLYVHHQSDSGG